jgi:hypothetical protein
MADSLNETEITKIKRRIRGLLSKTVEAGVTEGEAMLAAAKAAELLEKYDVEMAEIEEPVDEVGRVMLDIHPATSDALWRIGTAIANLCACRCVVYPTKREALSFVGYEADRDIAAYLMGICGRALKTEADAEDKRNALFRINIRKRRRLGFIEGMGDRLVERLNDLAWARRQKTSANALVPEKAAKIDEFIGDIPAAKSRRTISDDGSWLSGWLKAEDVGLNQAISHGDGDLVLGIEDRRRS